MSHLRSGFSGISVPIGADGSSHSNITNNITITNENKKEGVEEVSDGIFVVYPTDPKEKERDLKQAEERLEEIKKTQANNEKIIEALNLIIEIYYSNPLYINHWLIAEADVLAKLVCTLTDSERVDITLQDASCDCGGGCCGSSTRSITAVDTIYCVKGKDIKEFRYAYPDAKKILDDSHISTKLVALELVQ